MIAGILGMLKGIPAVSWIISFFHCVMETVVCKVILGVGILLFLVSAHLFLSILIPSIIITVALYFGASFLGINLNPFLLFASSILVMGIYVFLKNPEAKLFIILLIVFSILFFFIKA